MAGKFTAYLRLMFRWLFFILLPVFASAQVSVSDSFSDGNFTANPSWSGDSGVFEIDTANQLRLIDTVAGESFLNTASGIASQAVWEFYIRLEFNPSTSNFARVYLMSDQQNLGGALNGYFVRIGGSSNDRISLYKQTGNSTDLITESGDDWVDENTVEVRVQISRDSLGMWMLAADTSGGNNFVNLGSAVENTFNFSTHFGVVCEYTITRADKFYFDDFFLSGKVFTDNEPPVILDLEVLSNTELEITFSENVEKNSAEFIGNYEVKPNIGLPNSAVQNSQDERVVKLTFANPFAPNTIYELFVEEVEDRFGNEADDDTTFIIYDFQEGDVVINELMVDPVPQVGIPPNALPEREYVELFNRTALPIDLAGWVLTVGNSVETLPSYILQPDSFVVITKDEDVNEFPSGLPILGIDISGVALTNSGNTVSLQEPSGEVVSTVSYTDDWYREVNKEDGGWSLEQIDPDNLCGGKQNWRASIDPIGGTAGRTNSVFGVNPDTVAPEFQRIAILGDSSILLIFSETIEITPDILDDDTYETEPFLPVESVNPIAPIFDRIEIKFQQAIDPEVIYEFTLKDFPTDCSGNLMQPDTLLFTIPAIPENGDLLINEVLFNPLSGGSDFVEIYNHSDKIFDLSKLRLANYNPDFQTLDNVKELRSESFLIEPNRYLALTTDPSFLMENYDVKFPENVVEVDALPPMNDNEGNIAIATSSLQVVDYFVYSDDLHLPFLQDAEGVSLERVSFEKSAQEDDNWQSAAASAGFATAGYENSQRLQPNPSGKITLEPKVFSPNQDGHKDQLSIVYDFEKPNNVVSVSIWNSSGYEVRVLQENTNVAQSGFFTWDGTDENGQRLNSGIYIVVVEYFNESGESVAVRKTCVFSL